MLSCVPRVTGNGGLGRVLHATIGEIQLLAGEPQRLDQLLACCESLLPLAPQLPAVGDQEAEQHRCGKSRGYPSVTCRQPAMSLLALSTGRDADRESWRRIDVPQG